MAQVSYGTITITDTNDIESITVEYAQNQDSSNPPSSGWDTARPTWKQNYFIWQRTRIHKSGTTADKDTFGAAVCLTGSTGSTGVPGRGLTDTITQYCNYGTGEPANNYSGWVDAPPSYDSSKPNYWVKITNTYSAAPTSEIIKYKDEALSKVVTDAAIANSIAQHANEDSQGALSIATGINQHFFSIPNDYSTSVPAGSYITEINIDEFKQSPSGGNLLTRSDGIWLRNGADILASLQGTGLTFLIPTGTYKGRKSLEILGGTTPALKLYDAQNNNAVATLDSNGLVLSKGGIRVNTVGSNNGVYISSENLGSKVTSLDADKTNWRAVIGSKFGVDSEGNLYANEAHISGEITASKLMISSNATINDTSGLIRNDAIDIGGRNLVLNTAEPQKGNIGSRTTITDDYATLAGSTADWGATWGTSKMKPDLLDGTTVYTVSFEYRSTAALSDTLLVISGSAEIIDSSSWTRSKYVNWKSSEALPSTGGEWVKHSLDPRTISLSQLTSGSGDVNSFFLQLYNRSNEVSMDVRHFKLEKGNKATDWTPAPEDMESYTDTAISEVVPQIGEAQTQATEAAKAYSNEILESFSSKFTVSPEDISSEVVAIRDGETLVSRINQLPDSIKIEAKNIEIIDKYESYIELAADEANPYILLGKRENNAMLLRITNKRMGFEVNSEEVAYLAPDALHVQKQISFGDFIMKQRENGHLSIIRVTRGG